MKYYIDTEGKLFAFAADGSQDEYIAESMRPASAEEVIAIQNPVPSPQQIKLQLTASVQRHLDATAASRGYDSILSLCSYLGSSVEQFAAEAQAGIAWRDAVWAHCYQVMAAVESGARTVPTADALIAELPAIQW